MIDLKYNIVLKEVSFSPQEEGDNNNKRKNNNVVVKAYQLYYVGQTPNEKPGLSIT